MAKCKSQSTVTASVMLDELARDLGLPRQGEPRIDDVPAADRTRMVTAALAAAREALMLAERALKLDAVA